MAAALVYAAALFFAACSRKPSNPSEGPSQSMTDFIFTRTDLGVAQWRLTARRALLQSAAGDLRLEAPEMDVFKGGSPVPVTRLRAKTGSYSQESGDVRLQDEVVAVAREGVSEATTLRTESLDFISARDRFETDRPVRIDRGGSVMRGRGLRASRDLSEVRVLRQEATLR